MNPEEIRLLPEMQNQLGIKSLKDLETRLRSDRTILRKLAREVQSHYEPFPQEKKQKPFQRPSDGGSKKKRDIDNPSKELKAVQRRIHTTLLKPLLLPQYLHGAAPGKTIKTNAATHLGASTVVKMDITNYFPNLSNNHVYKIWTDILGCAPPIGRLLTRLTTFNRHLPQGAPTSSALANIYLASVMPMIIIASRDKEVKPSAYVDDLIFSGEQSRQMMEPMRQVLAKDGLRLSSKKRKVLGPKKAKVITGIRLGRAEVRAPHEKVKDLRAGIHKLMLGVPLPKGRRHYLESLHAKLCHIEGICQKDGIKLRMQLEQALKQSSYK
jgi:RNA-directed DNA polymerase